MTDKELQTLVENISLLFFEKPFRHQAFFNRRLKTTGGRYHLKDSHIDFNPLVLEKYGQNELIGVIKHELCHYHLHIENKGYQHRDKDFKELLKKTGGSRYVKQLAIPIKEKKYICSKCGTIFHRQRKIDTRRFACQCGGRLKHLTKQP